ncbi:SusC/RagA family TonB-linked outer membrane protein [Adhaeribacter aquaticus]|uniref:SusC/RagA family TonB-linked outer membrane protein n=1 Tax=Adhaeribacter aquaticus TaxID=299567 RepID=UPI0004239B24|nr:SusC/RagA family TonB-linked outer membrane protein [Adhaeribacter aquaticus]
MSKAVGKAPPLLYGKLNKPILQDSIFPADTLTFESHLIKKKAISGSVVHLTEQQLEAVPVPIIDQLIKGRVAGVQVTQNSGAPGSSASVRIRGINTIFGNAEPLYILDGVPLVLSVPNTSNTAIEQQPFSILDYINPGDIASIEVLKDVGATALYGARGANGVILITSKRGTHQKKNKVNFNNYFGWQKAPDHLSLLNTSEYRSLILAENLYIKPGQETADTNWQDEIFQTAPLQNHNLSYSGGSQNHRIYASAANTNQQGTILNTQFKRNAFRLNYDGNITPKLKIGISAFRSSLVNTPIQDGVVEAALLAPPIVSIKNTQGAFNYTIDPKFSIHGYRDFYRFTNPVAYLQNILYKESNSSWANLFAQYIITKGLQLSINYQLNNINQKGNFSYNYAPIVTYRGNGMYNRPYGIYDNSIITTNNYSSNNKSSYKAISLLYSKHIGQHSFNFITDLSYQRALNNVDVTNIRLIKNGNSSTSTSENFKTTLKGHNLSSLTAGLRYNYADKYFVNASLSRDGLGFSSEKSTYFISPAISATWHILSTPSSTSNIFFNDVKIRASFGQTGNLFKPLVSLSTDIHPNDAHLFPVEKTRELNAGVDLGFLKHRVYMSLDVFNRNTSNLFENISYADVPAHPVTYGLEIQNRGVELAINSQNTRGAFLWTTNFSFARTQNRITDLGVFEKSGYNLPLYLTKGASVASLYGYKAVGLYTDVPSEPPLNSFYDWPNKGDIELENFQNPELKVIGTAFPKSIYGIDNTLSYKKIALNFLLQGVAGNNILNNTLPNLYNFLSNGFHTAIPQNASSQVYSNSWRANNTSATIPRINGSSNNRKPSSYYIENGSYLRLRSITLSVNFPKLIAVGNSKIGGKLFISGQNLRTFTKYSGYDPEIGGRTAYGQGIDNYNIPVPRTYIMGINLTL